VEAAVKGGGLQRALKRAPGSTADELSKWAAGQYVRAVIALVGSALRAGKAVVGAERVRDAMNERRVELLLVAGDAGDGHEGLLHAAERLGRRCVVLGDRASLGKLVGRELVAVMAITDPHFAERTRDAAGLAAELGGATGSGGSPVLSLGSAWFLEAS
jgi:ribosomal protein L7Ae-like RNA K-turn-binding protein